MKMKMKIVRSIKFELQEYPEETFKDGRYCVRTYDFDLLIDGVAYNSLEAAESAFDKRIKGEE